ncbi:DUF5615 family PIN-like protein [Phaeodactylibacter xiamenensis]|jgi:predicted nuclease of predicted toxin-antitoxin system|uniref:DUF5615 domain-containing protein n=1 Tax=Phaeodactylibacter xiamenensis TaxID=1524460 RepID=A0A098RZP4_9BACT|nr:DUF5615 family PIN-like protein [Phaeodactylibacter xiamenensis]KGE85330.1 hypothetical protein IX84_27900 [Phaeodactylibacter xiamenensis]MCR9052449.1 DUF5615 family PIN-like protein [bacterium]
MNLLLDANISWRLIRLLTPHFEQIHHVEKCGLPIPASDIEIWNWAKANDAIIVTNDDDFYHFLAQKGFPPKIVLLRIGNQSTSHIQELIIRNRQQILALSESEQHGILEIV